MNRKRCQICDGPIENGRCKWCGMPYRNDEVLYHLNEDRSEHYRHATPEARRALRESEIPLGDKAGTAKPKGRKQAAPASVHTRENSGQRTGNSGGATHNSTYMAGRYQAGTRPYIKPKKDASNKDTNKRSSGAVAFIIMLLVFICSFLPAGIDYVKEHYAFEISSFLGKSEPEDYKVAGILTKQDGKVKVGQWIPAGRYMAVIESGYCNIEIEREDSLETVYFSQGNKHYEFKLYRGDVMSLHNVDTDDRGVKLYLVEEFSD